MELKKNFHVEGFNYCYAGLPTLDLSPSIIHCVVIKNQIICATSVQTSVMESHQAIPPCEEAANDTQLHVAAYSNVCSVMWLL